MNMNWNYPTAVKVGAGRISEIAGIQITNINLEQRTLLIKESIVWSDVNKTFAPFTFVIAFVNIMSTGIVSIKWITNLRYLSFGSIL